MGLGHCILELTDAVLLAQDPHKPEDANTLSTEGKGFVQPHPSLKTSMQLMVGREGRDIVFSMQTLGSMLP